MDMRRAAVWLCEAETKGPQGEGYSGVTTRALRWKARLSEDDEEDEWACCHLTSMLLK